MSADHAYGPPGPKVTNHVQAPCPSCGHCPTCGRGRVYFPYYPWYYTNAGAAAPQTWTVAYGDKPQSPLAAAA